MISIKDFFFDNPHISPSNPWRPLPNHSLVESPCYPIIGINNKYRVPLYYCKLHPGFKNINLECIEHHCRFSNPQMHKSEITKCLENILASHKTIDNFFLNCFEERPIKASHKNDGNNANNDNMNDDEKQITIITYM
jgi:hypothetical protein